MNECHKQLARDLEAALYAVRREQNLELSEFTLARIAQLAVHLDAVLFFAETHEPENSPV